ncbi:AAA family ATPase [Leclercia adecarboxylata]|uniref:AAA family ATPase n=1 Tax=Leclercia adecarboxylata TaxID=83655 RepID=UPI00254D7538|nr:AAA family ATPase [Leclercia adecarboxylata]MDK4745472.1 AAA family ATPase [Leclercia adecarboxylata]
MTIKLFKLTVSGAGKEKGVLLFNGKSHLIYGPTDTGKSYVVECIRYCFGGRDRPKDIGYSEGYTILSLQVKVNDEHEFTIFRSLDSNEQSVYNGFIDALPHSEHGKLEEDFTSLLVKWSNASGRLIVTKRGVKGNFSAGDIRFLSIFDEIKTLDKVAFIGSDSNVKTRNSASLALVLSGNDDSEMLLPLSMDEINKAKGHATAIEEQISALRNEIPDNLIKRELEDSLQKIDSEIKRINGIVNGLGAELIGIRTQEIFLDKEKNRLDNEIIALGESLSRFRLLDEKYSNDISRLEVLKKAAAIVPEFEMKSCPLCSTPLDRQANHADNNVDFSIFCSASDSEINKITSLKLGLQDAVRGIQDELNALVDEKSFLIDMVKIVQEKKRSLIKPIGPIDKFGFDLLFERKSEISSFIKTLEKIDSLDVRLAEVAKKTKKTKHKIVRNLSSSSTSLCQDIISLLSEWQVPGVDSISFDDKLSDIVINHRQRVSFGKGKRGIFLTAFMICLMERAIRNGYPHSGFLVIDSPVVTYKDPKHSSDDNDEELLDECVKENFYSWLGNKATLGQIIILENEEPSPLQKRKLKYTEFVGAAGLNGRKGFFPM